MLCKFKSCLSQHIFQKIMAENWRHRKRNTSNRQRNEIAPAIPDAEKESKVVENETVDRYCTQKIEDIAAANRDYSVSGINIMCREKTEFSDEPISTAIRHQAVSKTFDDVRRNSGGNQGNQGIQNLDFRRSSVGAHCHLLANDHDYMVSTRRNDSENQQTVSSTHLGRTSDRCVDNRCPLAQYCPMHSESPSMLYKTTDSDTKFKTSSPLGPNENDPFYFEEEAENVSRNVGVIGNGKRKKKSCIYYDQNKQKSCACNIFDNQFEIAYETEFKLPDNHAKATSHCTLRSDTKVCGYRSSSEHFDEVGVSPRSQSWSVQDSDINSIHLLRNLFLMTKISTISVGMESFSLVDQRPTYVSSPSCHSSQLALIGSLIPVRRRAVEDAVVCQAIQPNILGTYGSLSNPIFLASGQRLIPASRCVVETLTSTMSRSQFLPPVTCWFHSCCIDMTGLEARQRMQSMEYVQSNNFQHVRQPPYDERTAYRRQYCTSMSYQEFQPFQMQCVSSYETSYIGNQRTQIQYLTSYETPNRGFQPIHMQCRMSCETPSKGFQPIQVQYGISYETPYSRMQPIQMQGVTSCETPFMRQPIQVPCIHSLETPQRRMQPLQMRCLESYEAHCRGRHRIQRQYIDPCETSCHAVQPLHVPCSESYEPPYRRFQPHCSESIGSQYQQFFNLQSRLHLNPHFYYTYAGFGGLLQTPIYRTSIAYLPVSYPEINLATVNVSHGQHNCTRSDINLQCLSTQPSLQAFTFRPPHDAYVNQSAQASAQLLESQSQRHLMCDRPGHFPSFTLPDSFYNHSGRRMMENSVGSGVNRCQRLAPSEDYFPRHAVLLYPGGRSVDAGAVGGHPRDHLRHAPDLRRVPARGTQDQNRGSRF